MPKVKFIEQYVLFQFDYDDFNATRPLRMTQAQLEICSRETPLLQS